MEAAVRRADRIDVEVSAIENQMVQHFELAAQLGTLSRHSRELRASMIQQRSLLRELRRSLNEIRQALSTFNPDVK